MNYLQCSIYFLKACCRPLITSKFLASELPLHGSKSPKIAWGQIWVEFPVRLGKSVSVEPPIRTSAIQSRSRPMRCYVPYQQHWHPQINLFCLFPFRKEIWNNFWGNSPNSKMIFTLQMRTVRIIAGVKSRNSCRNLFMRLKILPLPCEYIFTLMIFVVNNKEHFQTNPAIQC
jgi:hypothetical protein